MDVTVCAPKGYEPDAEIERAAAARGRPAAASRPTRSWRSGAHAVYTDVWASMGQEDETEARRSSPTTP